MKTIYKFITVLLLTVNIGCSDNNSVGQHPIEFTPPGIVTNTNVESISGGAVISYTPPSDTDFSYVEAVYKVNDALVRTTKSTKYTQKITVDGFPNTNPQTVQLYAVDYNGNKSDLVEIEVTPLKPPYIEAFESLNVRNDFAGVYVKWENDLKKYIGITVLKYDDFNDFVPYEVVYDDFTTFSTNVRGMEPVEVQLGFFVRDEFGNISDTLIETFKPLYEIQLDKKKWKALALDTDVRASTRHKRGLKNGFDRLLSDVQNYKSGYISSQVTKEGYLPHHQTYDLGEENLISRFICHPVKNMGYKQAGWKKMEIYGTNDQSLIDRETNGVWTWSNGDDPYETGNWREEGMDGWDYIGEFETIKPSGLPGTQIENTDTEFAHQGFAFNVPPNASYRYVRFRTVEMWANVLYSGWAEMTLFGAPTN